MLRFVIPLLLLTAEPTSVVAANLSVVSPSEGQVVAGSVVFRVKMDEGATGDRLAAVRWRLNGQDLTGLIARPPYDWRWHSKLVYDGPALVQAVAVDQAGQVFAESAPVRFQVSNQGHDLRLIEPTYQHLRTEPIRGVVKFTLEAERRMTVEEQNRQKEKQGFIKPIEAIVFYLDGRLLEVRYGVPLATFEVDTTRLADGPHLLRATAWAFQEGVPPVAQLQLPFTVDNHQAAPPPLASSKPRERAPSLDLPGVPHFARSGKLLAKYEPQQSLWVRSLFTLSPRAVAQDQRLAARVREAGVTALETGFYINPADGSNPSSLESFREGYNRWFDSVIGQPLEKLPDFSLVLTGDDICRTPRELHNTVQGPWSREAVQYALRKARSTGQVVCIEMVDEISFLWGDTPTPADGRWRKHSPPLDDDAFVRLMDILNGVESRPPITWPVGGITGPEAAGHWMGNPRFSDYATQYWDVADWRRCYPYGASLPQMKKWLDHVVLGRAPHVQRDKPQLLLVSICGPWLGNGGAGREFTDPHDLRQFLDGQNNTDVTVAAQVMYAAVCGMAGVRCYCFDSPLWKAEREKGQGQTGSEPFTTGTNRWAGLSAAFNLIGQLEPYVLGQPIEPLDLGEDFAAGARQTERGRLLMVVNFSEVPRTVKVDLARYRDAGSPDLPLVRYRLHGATLSTEAIAPTDSPTVDFQPGEAILWLARARPDATGQSDLCPPSVRLMQPLAGAIIQGEIVIAANVADDVGVDRVELLIDGQPVGKLTQPPYQMRFDTSTLTPHVWHILTAVAHDAAGQRSEARQMFQVAPTPFSASGLKSLSSTSIAVSLSPWLRDQ